MVGNEAQACAGTRKAGTGDRWTVEAASQWYDALPWLVGCNFTPAYAVNQLEFWQAETFDPNAIDRELGWAAALGMNAVRVYLHDLLWAEDSGRFIARIETYLSIAGKHGIATMFVLFDSCWHPEPALGPQRAPIPGVHNPGWVQSPGVPALEDPSQLPRLQAYVSGVVTAFANDERVLAWDIWNEPDNGSEVSLCDPHLLAAKGELVAPVLAAAFEWARRVRPIQPLTSGIWLGDWSEAQRLSPIQHVQLSNSDIISFHNYEEPEKFACRVGWLKSHDRPVICTEYMARSAGSTFHGVLPYAKEHRIGAFSWGLVSGRTQTHLAWNATDNDNIERGTSPWFHDVLHPDGRPFCEKEAEFLKWITGKPAISGKRTYSPARI